MSATEILAQIEQLPPAEKQMLAEKFLERYGAFDDGLTPEQIAELDRRAEDALKHPGRGKPIEQVFAEIEERFRTKK